MPTKKTATGPTRMQIGIRVDMDLYDEVKVIAIRQRRRFNDMFEEAMKDLIEKYRKGGAHNGQR